MSRYLGHGEWEERDRRTYTDDDGATATIVVEQRDLLDTRHNHIYRGGTYRVTLAGIPGWRTKTFHGESAWSNAERYANDAATKLGDWRHPINL
jgi:hypothetical protein